MNPIFYIVALIFFGSVIVLWVCLGISDNQAFVERMKRQQKVMNRKGEAE